MPITYKIVSIVLLATCCVALKKGCRMSQLDSKIKPMTRMVSQMDWPENDKELDQLCKTFIKHTKEARNFTKNCAEGESKTILAMTVHSMEAAVVKSMCKNKRINVKQKFIASGKCGKTGGKTASKCWTKMLAKMNASVDISESRDKIPSLCCALLQWRSCLIKTYEDIGEPVCTPEHIEQIDNFLQKAMLDTLNVFCSEYDHSDRCNKFDEFFARIKSKPKYETPFPDIVTIFESL